MSKSNCTEYIYAGETKNFCVETFDPFAGIARGGLFSSLASLFNLMFLLLFIMWIIMVLMGVLDYVRSQGNEDLMEGGRERILNVIKGLSLGMFGLLIASAVGVLMGLGMPTEWSRNLAQCGDAPLYFQFIDENENSTSPVQRPFNVWCCPEGVAAGSAGGGGGSINSSWEVEGQRFIDSNLVSSNCYLFGIEK